MKAKIQRWGNSLAVRIPRAIAAESQLSDGSLVELKLVNGKVVLLPIREQKPSLEDLLAQVTDENLHREVGTGDRVGKETW